MISVREWDYASYIRKFSETLAYCSVGENAPSWRYIRYIDNDNGSVKSGGNYIGEVIREQEGKQTDLPVMSFYYAPIKCGFYKYGEDKVISILRKHFKSFKIGLSFESHWISFVGNDLNDIDLNLTKIRLDSPAFGKYGTEEIFGGNLLLYKNSLSIYGNLIGFIDGKKVLLKAKEFTPLVKKHMGDTWQILDL